MTPLPHARVYLATTSDWLYIILYLPVCTCVHALVICWVQRWSPNIITCILTRRQIKFTCWHTKHRFINGSFDYTDLYCKIIIFLSLSTVSLHSQTLRCYRYIGHVVVVRVCVCVYVHYVRAIKACKYWKPNTPKSQESRPLTHWNNWHCWCISCVCLCLRECMHCCHVQATSFSSLLMVSSDIQFESSDMHKCHTKML